MTMRTMPRILVTGATGMLGRDVCRELERRGYEYRGVGSAEMDVRDPSAVEAVLTAYHPETVIHCAAWTNVDAAEKPENAEACRAINAIGTGNVARACQRIGARMILISTDYVFSGQGQRPWRPEDPAGPLNVYGQSKWEAEQAIRRELERWCVVRTSWLYGREGKSFARTILGRSCQSDPLRVVNDQIGTPTFTEDLARLLVDMAEAEVAGTYHAVNEGGYISWYEFAREIVARSAGSASVIPVATEEYGLALAQRPKNSRLDTASLDEAGIMRLPDWRSALARFLSENPNS